MCFGSHTLNIFDLPDSTLRSKAFDKLFVVQIYGYRIITPPVGRKIAACISVIWISLPQHRV